MKAPFPWFGGKARVAPEVWQALGDVDNYVEPFAGSLAVLLGRPSWHSGVTETVNDADQYLANFWRALSHAPDEVARYADYPVSEADLFSRHLWLVNEGKRRMQEGMEADPDWYDAKIAGWWVWGQCAWIGSGWCAGDGPHTYATLAVGGNAGRGVNRQLPHLGDAGQGVKRQLPHLGTAGQGVNRKRPHLGNAGQGVNRKRLHLGDAGRGALYDYMRALAQRLRAVRVCCGDWSRVVTHGALSHGATVGVFLDPPYSSAAGRTGDLYAVDDLDVAVDVRAWAVANGDNPRYRIVLAGYEDEHAAAMPDTWRMLAYSANKAYGSSQSKNGLNEANRHKERLWFSPHCLQPSPSLFDLLPLEVRS